MRALRSSVLARLFFLTLLAGLLVQAGMPAAAESRADPNPGLSAFGDDLDDDGSMSPPARFTSPWVAAPASGRFSACVNAANLGPARRTKTTGPPVR